MRIVNDCLETITEYDLSLGHLVATRIIKEDALPINNGENLADGELPKWAWADEDWEDAQMYVLNPTTDKNVPTVNERVAALEAQLASYEAAYLEGVNEA